MNIEILKDMYRIHSPSGNEDILKLYLYNLLDTYDFNDDIRVDEDKHGNMYLTKGKSINYPCFVAHLDQVQFKPGSISIYTENNIIFGFDYTAKSSVGLGADDKNGIFICLEMLETFSECKVAFFVEEEIGCIGSMRAKIKFFQDCRWIIQPDRKGNEDVVMNINGTDICSNDFRKDITPIMIEFKYRRSAGLMTDVEELVKNKVGISCINVSCGYYSPHTDSETTDINDVLNCIAFCKKITETVTGIYKHQPVIKNPLYAWSSLKGFNQQRYNDKTGEWTDTLELPQLGHGIHTPTPDIICSRCKTFNCTKCKLYNEYYNNESNEELLF